MSSWHYYIESKSRMKITAEKGPKKDIEIKDVVEFTENRHKTNSLAKGKEDPIFDGLMIIGLIGRVILFGSIIIGNDVLKLQNKLYSLASDMVAISGLILTIISFNSVRVKIDKYMRFGRIGNRIFILLFILLITIYFASPLPNFNLENKFANIIGFLCFFISLNNFYKS